MRTTRTLVTLAAGSLVAGASAAQTPAQVLICDPINEHVYRLSDDDGDGLYLSANETTLLVDYASAGAFNPESAEMRDEGGTPVVYVVADFPDGVYRGADADGNGQIDGTELVQFWDSTAAFGSVNPEGLTLTADGAVWVSSNFEGAEGLWRLFDANGDGDAMDAGEAVQMVVGDSTVSPPATVTVGTDAGPKAVSADDLWRMDADGNGVVAYNGFSTSCPTDEDSIFRFEDGNSDGDVADAGEAVLFLNYTGKNPALPKNPDFGTVLRSQQVNAVSDPGSSCPGNPYWNRLNHVAVDATGATTRYYFASDASDTGTFSTNVSGLGLNGLIYRGTDLNLDGDVNDAGEVVLFYDGSFTSPLAASQQLEKIVGVATEAGWLYVADLDGGNIAIHRLRDANGDGDAMDAGEADLDLWSFGAWGPNPPILDPLGPFVEDIEAGPAGLFPPASSSFTTSGVGCSPFAPGPPKVGGVGKLQIGTSNFTATVSNTVPLVGAATLFYGFNNTTWLGLPLPFDLTPFGFPGCSIYHNLTAQLPTQITDGLGEAQVTLTVPVNPLLPGNPLYLQWLVINTSTGQLALSDLGTAIFEN